MKDIPPVQQPSCVFRINYARSKWPHFHRAYLVTVRKRMSIAVFSTFVLKNINFAVFPTFPLSPSALSKWILCFILFSFFFFEIDNFYQIMLHKYVLFKPERNPWYSFHTGPSKRLKETEFYHIKHYSYSNKIRSPHEIGNCCSKGLYISGLL